MKKLLLGSILILAGIAMAAADVEAPSLGSVYLSLFLDALCVIVGARFAFAGYRQRKQ